MSEPTTEAGKRMLTRWSLRYDQMEPDPDGNWVAFVQPTVSLPRSRPMSEHRDPVREDRLRAALEAELALLPDKLTKQFDMGAAAAYHWCLAVLAEDTAEPTTPGRDADAAWEALAAEFARDDRWTNASVFVARHRPLIEAAIRASVSPTNAARDLMEASGGEPERYLAMAAETEAADRAPRSEPLDVGRLATALEEWDSYTYDGVSSDGHSTGVVWHEAAPFIAAKYAALAAIRASGSPTDAALRAAHEEWHPGCRGRCDIGNFLDDYLAGAASGSPEPLDVERLARAMEDVFPGWLDEAPGTAEAQAEMRSYARQLGEAYEFLRDSASPGAALAPSEPTE